ncbi:MAG: type II secretion system protein GspM [Halieaceae bacterium]|jgi:general secretion pathway protein M|nr:type II secretion system protein M [Cellvibrionales bacterium]
MKDMFFNMTRREQIYVLVMVAAVGLWLLFTFALAPASAAREAMKASNESAINLLARVDAKATELIRIRQEGSTQNNGSLVSAVSRSSELAGLPVRRLQPNSRGEVQVRYEAVDYDDLARWLYQVEMVEGLVVVEASITQAGRSGGVNASVRVARPT